MNLSLKQMWLRVRSMNRLSFFLDSGSLCVVNQPWPDFISCSTIAAWRLSWGSGQKRPLVRLFAPAAHSWRVFASELPVTEANPPDASHFYLDLSDCFSIILLQQKLLDVLISPFGRDVVSLLCKYHSSSFVVHGAHQHACLLSHSVQVHLELVQRSESGLILDMELELR